jgi:hypothetical protein
MQLHYHIIFLAVFACAVTTPSSKASADDNSPAYLFDERPPGYPTNQATNMIKSWPSKSRHYTLSMLKANHVDGFALVARSGADKKGTVLGYGGEGLDVKWYSSTAGEIAIVDHQVYIGFNEIYVVKPSLASGRVVWELLFRTPDSRFTANDWTIAHCYWEVVRLDLDLGSIRLKGGWDFSNTTNEQRKNLNTEATYDVPLFYGAGRSMAQSGSHPRTR